MRTSNTDDELAAGFRAASTHLGAKTAALREGFRAQLDPLAMRALHRAATRAFDRTIEAAEAGYRLAVGPVAGLSPTRLLAARNSPQAKAWRRDLDELRTARQKHLLVAAGPSFGAVLPHHAPARVMKGMGPFWPQTDYLPESVIYRRKILMPLMEK